MTQPHDQMAGTARFGFKGAALLRSQVLNWLLFIGVRLYKNVYFSDAHCNALLYALRRTVLALAPIPCATTSTMFDYAGCSGLGSAGRLLGGSSGAGTSAVGAGANLVYAVKR